jgi:hypothetical protein
MKPFIFAAVLVAALLLCTPIVGATQQGIVQNGNGDSAVQIGGDGYVYVRHADVKETNTQYNSIHDTYNFEAPEQGPSVAGLSTGDASYTRMVFPNRFAIVPIPDNTSSITVRAGTAVALYTITSEYYNTVQGEQAIPDYNEIYDRMDHGTAAWESWIPYYTTYETIGIPSSADYLVVDNRNIFTSYNLIEITPHPIEEKQSY